MKLNQHHSVSFTMGELREMLLHKLQNQPGLNERLPTIRNPTVETYGNTAQTADTIVCMVRYTTEADFKS